MGFPFVERDKPRARPKKEGEVIDGDFVQFASELLPASRVRLTVETGVVGDATEGFEGTGRVEGSRAEERFLSKDNEGDFGRAGTLYSSGGSGRLPLFEPFLANRLRFNFAEGAGLGARFPLPPPPPSGRAEVERERRFEID